MSGMSNISGKRDEEATIIFKCTGDERQAILDIGRRAGATTIESALRFIIADYLKRHALPSGPHRVARRRRA